MASAEDSASDISVIVKSVKKRTLYKPSLKSRAWRHVSLVKEDKGLAVCDICDSELTYTGGNTSVFIKHLERKHGISSNIEHKDQTKDDTDKKQASIDKFVAQKPLDINSRRHKEITQKLLYLVIKDLQPLSIVSDHGMRSLLEYLEPRYRVVCRTTLAEKLSQKYREATVALKQKLALADTISLTTDGWSSCSADDYLAITVHTLTNWELSAYILTVKNFGETHTGENLAAFLNGTIEEWLCLSSDRKLYITTDNAANIVKGSSISL